MKITPYSRFQARFWTLTGLKAVIGAGMGLLLSANTAFADIPAPRVKPSAPNHSAFLVAQDTKTFRVAMREAALDDWRAVAAGETRLNNPVAKQLLKWKQAVDDPRASFDLLTDVFHNQPDWPRMDSHPRRRVGGQSDGH